MKSSELLNILECIGPLSLSAEFCAKFGAYDNSGILIDSGNPITGVLFSLDLSRGAVEEATRRGFNAIVTHHPAIYGGLKSLSPQSAPSSEVYACVRQGITVISMHLNFDCAPEGIDYCLMRGLGGVAGDAMIKLSGGSYGRAYDVPPVTLGGFIGAASQKLNTRRIIFYGDENRQIRRAASFCGAGCDDEAIAFAEEQGADVFVSSDLKHHRITALLSRNICVAAPTHYSAENYGFNHIYKKIIQGLNIPSAYYTDEHLL